MSLLVLIKDNNLPFETSLAVWFDICYGRVQQNLSNLENMSVEVRAALPPRKDSKLM